MSPEKLSAAPRRSSRKRSATAFASAADDMETELDEVDRLISRVESRKRQKPSAPKEPSARKPATPQAKAKAKPKAEELPLGKVNGVLGEMGSAVGDDVCAEEPDAEEMAMQEEEAEADAMEAVIEEKAERSAEKQGARKRATMPSRARRVDGDEDHFVGEPVLDGEARQRWPERYQRKGSDSLFRRLDEEEEVKARCHHRAAKVDETIYHLDDDVYVKAGPNEADYIGRITEFFEGINHQYYFTCRWFFRAEDTVISPKVLEKAHDHKHDPKRVFLSEEKNDNILECIVSKIKIVRVDPNMEVQAKSQLMLDCDLYYDMSYSVAYSTFANLPAENYVASGSETSNISCDDVADSSKGKVTSDCEASSDLQKKSALLLDLYSGCGGMSTGLCMGAAFSGLKLETRWAVDLNSHACESLKYNHPRTEVRNEKAEDFLALLREWDALCKEHDVHTTTLYSDPACSPHGDQGYDSEPLPEGTFEVEKLVGICYGDPGGNGKTGLKFKVRWKGYDSSYDTWEPTHGLGDCPERIKEFVETGYKQNILPLPGTVHVICGGPPCQGISGFNRFRKRDDPLKDEKNKQMVVFMDIVEYLRPKYVLMENVVDILKFADGYLGRYALSRLVAMTYQARLGMMVAGCYGLPQFRMRAFLWGALPSMVLPKYPLPTHDVVIRGGAPNAFSQSIVAYDETQIRNLRKALLLGDAISDLPEVGNHQPKDVMEYGVAPKTEFQRYIRLSRADMMDYSFGREVAPEEGKLLDHQPLRLNNDDYERVQQIPVKKGANFRDLRGVKVGANNVVEWDPEIPRVLLTSGKPLVPDYAMSFIKGKSPKPFGRLWWDETVPTVVTRAEPHNQIILHPSQARVLTIRENARLQGFPDYYRLFGPIKEKYIQVGNAVAVPVARALGYSIGLAYQSEMDEYDPLFKLPESFISIGQSTIARSSVAIPGGEVVEP